MKLMWEFKDGNYDLFKDYILEIKNFPQKNILMLCEKKCIVTLAAEILR